MRIAKGVLIIIGAAFLIFGNNISVSAESENVKRYKLLYNITDKEVTGLLEKLKREDSNAYDYYMNLKRDNPDSYELLILIRLVSARQPGLLSKGGILGESFDDYKKIFKIPDEEVTRFLEKHKKENSQLYQQLMDLKNEDPKMYNSALLGGIFQSRLSGISDPMLDNYKRNLELSSKIKVERSIYLAAKSDGEKNDSLAKLKQLFNEQFDLALVNLGIQINNFKSQLEVLNKVKDGMVAQKARALEKFLSGISQTQ